jgi:hypothetical protein
MNYTEVVDTVETPDGLTFRALIVQDDDAQEPEFDAGCPIIQVVNGRHGLDAEMTNYGVGQDDGLPDSASDIIERFGHVGRMAGDMRTGIDIFERYLHIYHDGNLVEYEPNQGTDYTYVAYVTRTLWESWGNTGEVGKAELNEWRAYVEGDTYGIMVEVKPTVEVDDDDDHTDYYGDVSHDGWTETDSTCWGFYGSEYATESAREELAREVAWHNDKDKTATLFQL